MSANLVDARRILHDNFGFSSFRDGQERLVGAALAGRDALGVLPTGGGKSLCYQVPALALPGLTLVLSPLISLMEDQTQRSRRASISAAFITSALSARERRTVLDDVHSGRITLLFVAPERLETPGFMDSLGTAGVSLIAVDEAHCISEWVLLVSKRVSRVGVPDLVPEVLFRSRRSVPTRVAPPHPAGDVRTRSASSRSTSDPSSSAAGRDCHPARGKSGSTCA